MLSDFHTHSLGSDGVLAPIELIRRAAVAGYDFLAITDHCGAGGLERVILEAKKDRELASGLSGIKVIVGVEITHVPPDKIDAAARMAKDAGAELVVVHGETVVEPVAPGTNLAALESQYVDLLSHPGLITETEARLAAKNSIFLELSGRKGHSLTNGHVAKMALAAGALMLVNSDGHAPGDLLSPEFASAVANGAGLSEPQALAVLNENPQKLVERLSLPN